MRAPRNVAVLREEWGGRCHCPGCEECRSGHGQTCARTHGLEFAHLQPTGLRGRGRGRVERYYDIRKNPSHYRLMCRDCHRLFDRTRVDGGPVANFGPNVYADAEQEA